jgi:hypothetical protein
MNSTEDYISSINSNFFFKEFSFSKNKFKTPDGKVELELADNFVWLDEYLFIIQIKDRNRTNDNSDLKWFQNKILKTAVKQIKNSIDYLNQYKDIEIINEKGHKLNITDARKISPIKLIIYTPDEPLPEEIRFRKFYISQKVGYIHLLHSEDYYWICKYLVTPFEIHEFLTFRERFYREQSSILDSLPEQYILGHYIETMDVDHINPAYIENIKNLQNDFEKFDVSYIISNFQNKMLDGHENKEYYQILKEIAKLNRADLRAFKERYLISFEKARYQEQTIPYRMTSYYSKCGFVFIPLPYVFKHKWENAIKNYTEAHKYDQKLNKCIGCIVFYNAHEKYYDINWYLIDAVWEFNEEFENILKEKFPFREVKMEKTYRYYVKK